MKVSVHYSFDAIAIIEFPDGTAGQVGITLHNHLPSMIDEKYVLTPEELNAALLRNGSVDLHISDWTDLIKGNVSTTAAKAELTSPSNTSANGMFTTLHKQIWISRVGVMTVNGKSGLVCIEGGAMEEATPRFFEVSGAPDLIEGIYSVILLFSSFLGERSARRFNFL